jgi:hypothetical protein
MMSAAIYACYKTLLLVQPAIRQALCDRHKWIFHDTSYEAMQNIRITELEVRDPGVIDPQLLNLIDQTLGQQARRIVCLKPVSSPVAGSNCGPQVRLSLCRKDVPVRIGVDWSNEATTLALSKLPAGMPAAEAFVSVVEKAGSFASYDPVQPSLLRSSPVANPGSDPATWPRLVDVRDDRI